MLFIAIGTVYSVILSFVVLATNRSFISSAKVNPNVLSELVKMSDDFKKGVESLITQQNYMKQQSEKTKEMLGMIERTADTTRKVIDVFKYIRFILIVTFQFFASFCFC